MDFTTDELETFYKPHYTDADKNLIAEYLTALNNPTSTLSFHRQAIFIAQTHLKTSFDLLKSSGFLKWLKERKNAST
jgi:hypothetical protein